MSFTAQERPALLACKGVGPKVIERLEQMGFSALAQLREASVDDIVAQGAALVGSTCWKNSPQAKAAISNAIARAKTTVSEGKSRAGEPGPVRLHLVAEGDCGSTIGVLWRR